METFFGKILVHIKAGTGRGHRNDIAADSMGTSRLYRFFHVLYTQDQGIAVMIGGGSFGGGFDFVGGSAKENQYLHLVGNDSAHFIIGKVFIIAAGD